MRENIEKLPNKVSLDDIFKKIVSSEYIRMSDGRTTICHITLRNGFTVRGESACVDPKEYNLALGEKYAYENAIDKIWQLEGYLLCERRHQAGL